MHLFSEKSTPLLQQICSKGLASVDILISPLHYVRMRSLEYPICRLDLSDLEVLSLSLFIFKWMFRIYFHGHFPAWIYAKQRNIHRS